MPIRSTTHSKKSLRVGAVAFIPAYKYDLKTSSYRDIAKRITIAGTFDPMHHCFPVDIGHSDDTPNKIFPGDRGVRGYRYDDRAQQCFTTRKACERAIARWKGVNPNMLSEIVPNR